jgi:hypothetical protein
MKLTFALLLIAVVAALPLAAASIDTAKFAQTTGVRLDGGAKLNIAEGQTLTAKVVNAAALAKLGLKGVKNGEVIHVTLLSLKNKKLKLMHVASGAELTYIYGEVYV